MAGIRPEQGPPLAVPLSFFAFAPLTLLVTGGLLAWRGGDETSSVYGPTSVALVHAASVGLLMPVMLGALYQMLPVVAGAVLPWPKLAHAVLALWALGAASLLVAQATSSGAAFGIAWPLLSAAAIGFLAPAGWAVGKSEAHTPTSRGLALALAALALVVIAGARLAAVRAGLSAIGPATTYTDLRVAHLSIGVLVWVGGLLAAVSWQVLPMFFLAPAPSRELTRVSLGLTALSLVLLTLASVVALPLPTWTLAIPGALSAWAISPGWAITALRARKRKRKDPTLWFWWLGAGAAPLCLVLAGLTLGTELETMPRLLGLVVAWGWAGAIVHGMLLRIVAFLVWLHRCAPHVGSREVPSAKELLTDRDARLGFVAHTLSLGLGAIAVLTAHDLAWRVFGVSLGLVGLTLARSFFLVLRRAP